VDGGLFVFGFVKFSSWPSESEANSEEDSDVLSSEAEDEEGVASSSSSSSEMSSSIAEGEEGDIFASSCSSSLSEEEEEGEGEDEVDDEGERVPGNDMATTSVAAGV